LGTTSATAFQFDYGICYRASGSSNPPVNFVGDYYSTGKISSLNNRVSFAATASVIPGAGTWEIGFCVKNSIRSIVWTIMTM
jgi:hypothetical protein